MSVFILKRIMKRMTVFITTLVIGLSWAAWVKRSDRAVFDPWGVEPTVTVKSLNELCEKIASQR
jgi:hypothetical protein